MSSMYPPEVDARFYKMLLETGDYESYFVYRIRPEIQDEVRGRIPNDMANDPSLSEAERMAFGVLQVLVEKTGRNVFSLHDLADIFELPTRYVTKLLHGLEIRRSVFRMRRGLGSRHIWYHVLSRS